MLLFEGPPRLGEGTVRPKTPRAKRFGQKLAKRLILAARIILFFVFYLVWPLLRRWLEPDIVFLVYGTARDQRAYWPAWATKLFRPAFPIGFIRYPGYWGFVATTPLTVEELVEHPDRVSALFDDCLREFPGAKTVSLAGRLPSLASKGGIEIRPPFIEGTVGTCYAMLCAARALAKNMGKNPHEIALAVPGGAGHVGSRLIDDLAREFRRVIAVDPRYANGESREFKKLLDDPTHAVVITTAHPTAVQAADAVVVLTAKGDDIEDYVPYFRPGTFVADDTHPPIHEPIRTRLIERGVDLWKATMGDGRLGMYPRLPNFRRDSIPGCLLEALVVLHEGREVLKSQQRFNEAAERLGFRAELIRHPED